MKRIDNNPFNRWQHYIRIQLKRVEHRNHAVVEPKLARPLNKSQHGTN